MTKVLFVVSECAPFVKTGGLADVAGALPIALAQIDINVRVLLPGYSSVMEQIKPSETVARYEDLFGGPANLLSCKVAGLDMLILDAPHLYNRGGGICGDAKGVDWPDNPKRFAALCKVGAKIAKDGVDGWKPDVVHGHDWQAGLTPEYMLAAGTDKPFVFTVHNIAFHGNAPADQLEALELNADRFTPDKFEYWGKISALKAGLMAADKMDRYGNKEASDLISMIKVVCPRMACEVIDRAIQIHGAGGLSDDFFLAGAYSYARTLRLADGPDEVHLSSLAKKIIQRNQ